MIYERPFPETPAMKLPRLRFTVRRWMAVVAVVAVVLAVLSEFKRMEQRRVDAQIRLLVQALKEDRLKYPWRVPCRGLVYFEYRP